MPPVPAPGGTGLAQSPRPAGDPDGLRSVRDALIGPTAGLISFAVLIDGQAQVPGWEGPAAGAFAGRMHEIASRLRAASSALGDGEQGLTSLAESLRQAQEFWDWAQALSQQGLGGGGLRVDAEAVASSAAGVATRQFDDAAQRLVALTHQARNPLPKPLVFPINPCGLLPEEAAGAFWNLGMMPINTECVGVVEVTIDVDGMPVDTFEAVPIHADSNESKSKRGGDEAVQSPEDKARIRARINRQLAVGTSDEKFEADSAKNVLAEGFQILKFRAPLVTSEGVNGELDFETSEALVEVTTRSEKKAGQISKYLDPAVNPSGKPVILYAPNYTKNAEPAVTTQGVSLVRTQNELIDLLFRLKGG